MNKNEIKEFIEQMEETGDIWEEDEVELVYGKSSLDDALKDRKSALGSFFDIISKTLNNNK